MFRSVIPALLAAALTACGGGGGGGSSNISTTESQQTGMFGAVSSTVSFQYYRDGSVNNPVSSIFSRDIDGDGIDEIFFVAFETQPNTAANYSNTSVHILGWENGVFKEITSRWLPGTSNQVEGVGDLCFGDFNGDGRVDVFLSAYTDMTHPVHPYALMNNGSTLTKVPFPTQTWMHAVACSDINNDGYDDVMPTGYSTMPVYFGSALGLTEYTGFSSGSGIALGDFLGNGTKQVVITDAGNAPYDTKLYSLTIDSVNKTVAFTQESLMPIARIDSVLGVANAGHDMRVRAVDFDSDGKLDVIVFSNRFNAPDGDHYRSEIQFLRNTGSGHFVDVTDSVRVGYNTHNFTGYSPQILDINGDDRLDIFVSLPVYSVNGYHGTAMLIQDNQGRYVDTTAVTLGQLVGDGQAAVAKGPGGQFYLVKESGWIRDGWSRVVVQPIRF